MSGKQVISLGVIGIGNIGSKHCRYIVDGETPEIVLTAVADRSGARRDWAKSELPKEVRIFSEGIDLIKSGCCDAVLIATPHYQHPGLAIQAFEQGLHVMCEKPAGVYTLQVRDMIKAADNHPELAFGMMFNQRANSMYIKILEMLKNGELGEIKRVNWLITDWYRTQAYYDSGAWRATWAGEGGGVLLNQCPHQLDLLQWLCGMPKKVQAFAHEGKWHDIEVEDDVTAYLEYENGATGVFITSTADAPGTNRLEITGTRGRLVCENDVITFDRLLEDERVFCFSCKEGFQKPPFETNIVETDGQNPHHAGVMRAFAAHILHGAPLLADGREGINGLTLSNAMHLSSWLKQPVTLPMDEQLFLDELNKRRAVSRHKSGPSQILDTDGSY
ncbi:MAG: Gfo/Idh/MocA family oxidoreductase [Bacillota bacterium]|nr:Gfo/Idh/MocA family oxidoreductase [Bacillota bacterium]